MKSINKKITLGIIISFITFVIILSQTWHTVLPARPFYSNDTLLKELNNVVYGITVENIIDPVHIDERNVFVPFITTRNQPGMSYWAYENKGWQLVSYIQDPAPHLWTINNGEEKYITYYFHPESDVATTDFYLIGERYYSQSTSYDGATTQQYIPKIQMKFSHDVSEVGFNVVPIPEIWDKVWNEYVHFEKTQLAEDVETWFYSAPHISLRVGWIPKTVDGASPSHDTPYTGTGGGAKSAKVDYIYILNDFEIE
ncbi:hypothetical protein [Sutcliffiella cohnii]|uniref:hypothetical protein n=1 Tax=Sutcliffiella cohnii TaxID=33932 RepID=UPI002E22BB3C|nr:hypothetical protein [Sutcliffiella cohnii]